MANQVDPNRHHTVFNPITFGQRRIDIIGCGATGSRMALELAKMGVSNLHIWDFDIIEEHNIANQAFGIGDIGKKKVDALADIILAATGLEVVKHDERVTGRTSLGSVVFLLTDTMSSRKEIWEGAIRFKPMVDVMIETRMGKDEGRVYLITPTDPASVQLWEATLFSDEEATESLCGSSITVGPTASLVSGYALWAFIRWFEWTRNGGDQPEAEMLFFVHPLMVMANEAATF